MPMDFYHSWIYMHFLNTSWFVWSIVSLVFAFNIFAPILIWFVMSGRKMWENPRKKGNKKKQGANS
jgi:cytoskeletal protein RodZ